MLENREGQTVPNVTFRTRRDGEWVDVTTDDIFAGKTVVLFALPGAFTPTCSAAHLPRYNELAPVFRDSGVDDIVCLSVNDTFVMNAWQDDQGAENITMLPDGNGEFSDGMGMLVDKSDLGFGKRSWRYSMVVRDKVIEKMFIEPDVPGDPYDVSDADTMLKQINPQAREPDAITVFTKSGCPYCAKAKAALKERGMDFMEITLSEQDANRALRAVASAKTVPQVFINGRNIGGSEELEAYLAAK